MSKIFRLYKEGADTYQDWNESPAFPYTSNALDTIDDPDGATARNEITSIPSPFARIDLVKRAFKEVCKMGLDGKTIFHKMVSDALDVGEIFFNIEKYAKKVEIITWDATMMLDELKNSNSSGHQYLGDSLGKYMLADASTYNFGQLRNIYLLNYVNGEDELNIIGATSPATLFFSTANDLSYIEDIYFGQDRPFDNNYQALYQRDFEYVKMWFLLRKTIPNFSILFPELETYLNLTFKATKDVEKKKELNDISITDVDNFSEIDVKVTQQADIVEVLGHSLYRKKNKGTSVKSDFIIDSKKNISNLPLVLPIVSGSRYSQLKYTIAQWGTTNKAPYYDDETNLDKRVLPNDASVRPYLTISDFLEDTIVRVPHKLNKDSFFDGNIALEANRLSYLLPIKPLLFNYFDIEELRGTLSDGKNMFEMETVAGGSVKATLRIPIKGNRQIKYIEYTRIYYKGRVADIDNNEGGMTVYDFTGIIMPIVKYVNVQDAYYTIACISDYSQKYDFKFYNNSRLIEPISKNQRNTSNSETPKSVIYTIEKEEFDYIQIKDRNNDSAILVPLFKRQKNIDNFEFAIDLGTSNTHIEYRIGSNGVPTPFKFDKKDTLVCEMFIPSFLQGTTDQDDLIEEEQLIEKDFLPKEIGGEFKFPTRTVLSYSKDVDWTDVIYPFSLVNIPMTYDKRRDLPYNNIKYNIKWGKGNNYEIESYIECLMIMIRNKVLLNNGNLKHTKITWFYPISMSPKRLMKLKNVWDDSYNKYFSNENGTNNMTESVAPILYFFGHFATATNLVNVDIGGGTTDIAFAKNNEIQFITSFKFASNTLFENPFSELDTNNGIVDWYKNDVYQLLEEKKLDELKRIFNSPNNSRPSNMASFLFSLVDNSMIKEKGISTKSVDFNYILQNDENFKIVFVLFYTSIIYHIAQIVKIKGLIPPRHITFSGNGSRIIKVLSTDRRLLAQFTKIIFEKVLGTAYPGELEILGLEKDFNPKESTCKGGIVGNTAIVGKDKIVVFKTKDNSFVKDADIYGWIDDSWKMKSVESVQAFFNFALNTLNSSFNFDDNFGVTSNSLKLAKEVCKKDLMTFLEKGIAQRMEESLQSDKIEETFFFYPIKGVLNALSSEIFESLVNNRNGL